MQRKAIAIGICLLGLLACAAIVAPVAGQDADEDEFPRAEAGVDQTVQRNASVLLDATQSYSPSGELVEYDWQITAPDGTSTTPSCDSADCSLARFSATQLGQYEVTVTVEDDQGRRESDTMYVTTVPRGDFGVKLTGPSATAEEGNLTATVAPGDTTVANITWYRGDTELGNRSLPANGGVFNESAYIVPGATYRAVVADTWNRTASATWTAPGMDSWVPTYSGADEFPRIEGPALITGSPDRTQSGQWVYEGAHYTVLPGEYGTVEEQSWSIAGSSVAPDRYSYDSQTSPPMTPGLNVVIANTEVSFTQATEARGHSARNQTAPEYLGNVSEEASLRRRVVVDPAPEIETFSVSSSGDSLRTIYRGEDRYNPVEKITISVAGTQVYSSGSTGDSFSEELMIDSPSGERGETTVRMRVKDGRGQTSIATDTADLPLPDQSDLGPNPVDNLPPKWGLDSSPPADA